MTFVDPPSRTQLGPRQLQRELRTFRSRAREKGLLRGEQGATVAGMETRAASLLACLRRGDRLAPKLGLQLSGVLAWLYQQRRTADLEEIKAAAIAGAFEPLLRDWYVLLCLSYTDPKLRQCLVERHRSWRPRSRRKLERRLGGLKPTHISSLPNALATRVVKEGHRIDEVSKALQLPPGCELEQAVWARLLSREASPWMCAQPLQLVDSHLEKRAGQASVGLIGRQILEPAALAGAAPEDVARDQPLARVVEMVARRMPRDSSAAAWTHLGKQATELLRWWQTQRDLEKFFRDWNADPERERFWRAYVRHIRDITPYRSASALAMKIGGYWFVEFGAVGNASRAYRDEDWRRARPARLRARRPTDLKHLSVDRVRSKSHTDGWQPRFVDWVRGLTGASPNGSVW